MRPLQIDCRLGGPWCPPAYGMHLDAVLAYSLVNACVRAANTAVRSYDEIIADLPLERHDNGVNGGVWKASVFHPVGWLGQERRSLVAKTDVEHMSGLIAAGRVETKGGSKIDTVRGIAKNAQTFFTIEHAQGLRAWCIGDADAIDDLLSEVFAVGVKTRIGFGSLLPFADGRLWRVSECEDAAIHWMRRSSPTRLIEESYPAIGSWRPPYWRGSEPIYRPFPARLPAEVSQQAANTISLEEV